MKVALVYDRVNKMGGAERILEVLHELYPDAPLFTLVQDEEGAPWSKNIRVITSFLQKIPFARKFHEYFPVVPIFAFEQFDFSPYDIVISVTAGEAKGIITGPHTFHICYILTPTRYLWSHYEVYFTNQFVRMLSSPIISAMRLWDQTAAQRPDRVVAISKTVQRRIKKYYKRVAEVIYPPVNIQYQISNIKYPIRAQNYFLIVSRLVKYKRIDIAIEACNQLKLPLKIIGEGLDRKRLEKLAGHTVEFLGNLTDDELSQYYQNCRAVLFTQEEDFGIVAVEALSYSKPVIAYREGGAVEIITEGKSGEFFYPQTTEALMVTLEKSMNKTYSQGFCREASLKFSKEHFKSKFSHFVNDEWKKFEGGAS